MIVTASNRGNGPDWARLGEFVGSLPWGVLAGVLPILVSHGIAYGVACTIATTDAVANDRPVASAYTQVASLPGPAEVRRLATAPNECGLDFVAIESLLDQIEALVDLPLSEDVTRSCRLALVALGPVFRGNGCVETCRPEKVVPEARDAVDRLRRLTLSFYLNDNLDPTDRRAALVSTALVRIGPDYWRTGFEAIVESPLQPPPGKTWAQLHRESGLHRRFDLDVWKVGYSPAGILRRLADQQSVSDFRLDVAALISASMLEPHERYELFRDYEVSLHDYRGLEWKLNAVKESLRQTLQAEWSRTGSLPQTVHSERGDLKLDCCLALERNADEADRGSDFTPSGTEGPVLCWFTGWPGIRVFDYEVYGDICLMRTVGYGFDYESPWWLAFEANENEEP